MFELVVGESGGPKMGPSLTAAAHDGRIGVRVGTEEWLRRGPNKRMDQRGPDAVRSDTLIPSSHPSTKPGRSKHGLMPWKLCRKPKRSNCPKSLMADVGKRRKASNRKAKLMG
jgi:hypothetical protein